MNIDRKPLTDPAYPGFLDVTGTSKANTDVEVVQWTLDGAPPVEVARLHVWRDLSGCWVDRYREATAREFYTLKFGNGTHEAVVFLSAAQLDALRGALAEDIPSHLAGKEL